ncbi:acyltransferase family protein [Vibrio vulnificus]|nr:acyltransferase family protein [Vibrio vulnificus]
MKNENRNKNIDFLRGIAIVGVVLIHSYFPNKMSDETLSIVANFQYYFNWVVLAFFYSSGYFSTWHIDKSKIKKLFIKLIIPCLFFSIFYLIVKVIVFYFGGFNSLTIESIFLNAMPMAPQFYFLLYLFIVIVISHILNIWFLILASSLIVLFIPTPSYLYGSDITLIPFYFLSYAFGYISHHKSNYIVFTTVAIISVIKADAMYLFLLTPSLIMVLSRYVNGIIYNITTYLGRRSLAIYVLHTPIILPLLMGIMTKISNYSLLNFIISVGLTIVLSIFIFDIIELVRNKYEKSRRPM